VRREALVAARWLLKRGLSLPQAASRLGLHVATLRLWNKHRSRRRRQQVARGRPPNTLPVATRQDAIAHLDRHRARGVRSLRRLLASAGRNALSDLIQRYRFLRGKRRRRRLCRLQWHEPGAVWAIDGTWLPWPVEGAGRQALVIVDLGARAVLACRSIPGERAGAILACLEDAVSHFGAPLVIKWDNGSGFVAAEVQRWCRERGIALLHSPPRRPSYNGSCEASNRWAKTRILRAALADGARGTLRREHLDAACTRAVPSIGLPRELRERFAASLRQTRGAVAVEEGLADSHALSDAQRRSLERVAVRRALQECHILTIRGRDYRW